MSAVVTNLRTGENTDLRGIQSASLQKYHKNQTIEEVAHEEHQSHRLNVQISGYLKSHKDQQQCQHL
jgi:hypothetical protein